MLHQYQASSGPHSCNTLRVPVVAIEWLLPSKINDADFVCIKHSNLFNVWIESTSLPNMTQLNCFVFVSHTGFQPELTFSTQSYVSDHLIVKMLHNFIFEINLKWKWLGINIGFQLVQAWRLKSSVWYKNKAIQLCHIGQRSGFNPDIK